MITKVSEFQKAPDAIQRIPNSAPKRPGRIVNETVEDNVKLSREGIQKSETANSFFQELRMHFESESSIHPEQQENIEKLIADLKAIQEKSDITQKQKEILKNDIKSTLQDAHKPDRSAIDKLVKDISGFIFDGRLGYREMETLQDDINLLLNSANISDEEIEILKKDFQAIGESSNISEEDLETLWNEIVQITETAKKVNNL
jgi:hypothetical protein